MTLTPFNYVAFFETCVYQFWLGSLDQIPKNCWFPEADDFAFAYCMGGEL